MSSRRRGLLSHSRRAEPYSRPDARRGPAELPPYEPPSCPLNELGKRALAEISHNRDTHNYEKHLRTATQLLRESVGLVNDRLAIRRGAAEQLEAKRGDSDERAALYERHRKAADALAKDVDALTARTEKALREVIDLQVGLEDERAVVAGLQDEVIRRQEQSEREGQARRAEREDEDVDMEDSKPEQGQAAAVVGVMELLKNGREAKAEEYGRMGVYEKYGLSNDYIAFKRTWHDAVNQDTEAPLPDARAWFTAEGEPVGVDPRGRAKGDDEEEDDLVVEREVRSYTCPLTLLPFVEPYSNRLCKHTFEKSAILGMIRQNGGSVNCPQTACNQTLNVGDFYLDDSIIRKMKRAEEARRRNIDDTSDIEPEEEQDPDVSVAVERTRNIKAERKAGRRGRQVQDDVEDE